MKSSRYNKLYFSLLIFSFCLAFYPFLSFSQEENNKAQISTIFFSPLQQTVIEGSIFDVSVYLDTHKESVNTINIKILFDPHKLELVRPSNGKSFVSLWIEPLSYSNINGTAQILGVIKNGLNTESGLITTITFKAIAPGITFVNIASSSKILANDGLGTEIKIESGRGIYNIVQKPPAGPRVFSDTHPFESNWYNNKNPILGWEKDSGATDFSFILDDKPNTIPDDVPETQEIQTHFTNLNDGIWYFHIKARKKSVWGATTNFVIRIDSIEPISFQPTVDILTGGGRRTVAHL